jgi:hypothetical protein
MTARFIAAGLVAQQINRAVVDAPTGEQFVHSFLLQDNRPVTVGNASYSGSILHQSILYSLFVVELTFVQIQE